MLIALRRIERLDKDEFSDEERQEAEEIYEQRRQEALQAQEEGQVCSACSVIFCRLSDVLVVLCRLISYIYLKVE